VSVIRLLVTAASPSGLPEDTIANTWYCRPALGETDENLAASDFRQALSTFYNALTGFYSSETITGAWLTRAYRLTDAKPRSPLFSEAMGVNTSAGQAYPRELAVCLSYKGSYLSGSPRARHRGRVYLGPLKASLGATATGEVRLAETPRAAIINAAGALLAASTASSTFDWVVYSPTNDPAGAGASVSDLVAGYWVDNAFDIQRRRGSRASIRSGGGIQ
jgi:hypothetical protein